MKKVKGRQETYFTEVISDFKIAASLSSSRIA